MFDQRIRPFCWRKTDIVISINPAVVTASRVFADDPRTTIFPPRFREGSEAPRRAGGSSGFSFACEFSIACMHTFAHLTSRTLTPRKNARKTILSRMHLPIAQSASYNLTARDTYIIYRTNFLVIFFSLFLSLFNKLLCTAPRARVARTSVFFFFFFSETEKKIAREERAVSCARSSI